jgi:hypothetical protein
VTCGRYSFSGGVVEVKIRLKYGIDAHFAVGTEFFDCSFFEKVETGAIE